MKTSNEGGIIMKQEEIDLVLRDLCARIPYGVMCDRLGRERKLIAISIESSYPIILDNGEYRSRSYTIEEVKPYLRPLSSMTIEEEREMHKLLEEIYDFSFRTEEKLELLVAQQSLPYTLLDYCNEHCFDYRGLIEKGLALVAPDGMYKF